MPRSGLLARARPFQSARVGRLLRRLFSYPCTLGTYKNSMSEANPFLFGAWRGPVKIEAKERSGVQLPCR